MHDDTRKPVILVADDDPTIRMMAEESLQQGGFIAKTAENGALAVEEFRKSNPDLVLLDVIMPEMDGFGACSEIRKSPGGGNTPILMLTGMDDVESINCAYDAGATDFQSKPVNWIILLQRIRYMLRSRKAFDFMLESEAKNQALLSAIPDLMFTFDRDGRFIDYKPSKDIETFTTPDKFLNKPVGEILPKDVADTCLFHIKKALQTKDPQVFEYLLSDDDRVREYEARAVINGEDKVLTIVRDITEKKQSARALIRERDFIAKILDTTSALVIVRDYRGRVVRFNRACEKTTGYSSSEVSNKLVWDFLLQPEEVVKEKTVFQELLMGKASSDYQSHLITKKGESRLISWINSTLLNVDERIEYIISTGIDITERQQAESKVQFLAYYDGLTNLPNRILFKERLNQALAYSQRHERLMAVLFIDIDRFKQINDTFGHSLGDLLLRGIAGRLKAGLRRSDYVSRQELGPLETSIGRFGGDEFTVLIPDVPNAHVVAKIADRILKSISRRFILDEQEIFVTSSIGISIYPHDGTTAEALLKNADIAMYSVKDLGRNGYNFFNAVMNEQNFSKLSMENDLRKAITRDEFTIYYQPKVDLRTLKPVGAEALLRWNHPSKGLISPSDFIPLAEESGLIRVMGFLGLKAVCNQSMEWQKSGVLPIPIAINLSAIQFKQKELASTITRILSETGLDPKLLELEITESTIMQNEEEAGRILMQLKDLGIHISIDDFGTGYSSLYYLKRFTLDALKIDRSFIKDLSSNADDRAITSAIIVMAHTLGLKVTAEGVEDKQHLKFLQEQDCDQAQGFLFSRPIPADEFIDYIVSNDDMPEANISSS
jgi:diguanylate cyclase (GGDEF)-like protein/PAS domain S-box-containing protein